MLHRLGWRWGSSALNHLREHRSFNQVHQQQRLKDGITKLWRGAEELGRLSGVLRNELFHLSKDLEELRDGHGFEGLGDFVGGGETVGEVRAGGGGQGGFAAAAGRRIGVADAGLGRLEEVCCLHAKSRRGACAP